MLLALKVLAHRVGEDEDDVRVLAVALGLSTSEEVLDIVTHIFGDRLDPAAQFFVEGALPPEAEASGSADPAAVPVSARSATPTHSSGADRPPTHRFSSVRR